MSQIEGVLYDVRTGNGKQAMAKPAPVEMA